MQIYDKKIGFVNTFKHEFLIFLSFCNTNKNSLVLGHLVGNLLCKCMGQEEEPKNKATTAKIV